MKPCPIRACFAADGCVMPNITIANLREDSFSSNFPRSRPRCSSANQVSNSGRTVRYLEDSSGAPSLAPQKSIVAFRRQLLSKNGSVKGLHFFLSSSQSAVAWALPEPHRSVVSVSVIRLCGIDQSISPGRGRTGHRIG